MSKTNEIETIYDKEKLKVTCVERKYKISGSRVSYIIAAKKELDENVTERLLHEDMELKTFLANYEITNIMLPVRNSQNAEVIKERVPKKIHEYANIQTRARTRRELIDILNLPEEFTTRDYEKALDEHGIKVSNTAMSNDDLRELEKKGKVIRLDKKKAGKHGRSTLLFKRLKKDEDYSKSKMEINETIQSLKDGHRALIGTFKD
jgi:hypothetical protein